MKKKIVYALATLTIGVCVFVGCSSDGVSDSEIPIEAQVEIIKQKYLYFADMYGVTNIGFDDQLLKEHLDLTDSEIEYSVIRMAMAAGVLDTDISDIRKKHRTRSSEYENPEINWGEHYHAEVTGEFSDSKVINDTLVVYYTIQFFRDGYGTKNCPGSKAYLKKRHQSPNGWVEERSEYSANTDCTINIIAGSVPLEEGKEVSLDVTYTLKVMRSDNMFNVNKEITETYIGAKGKVTKVTLN